MCMFAWHVSINTECSFHFFSNLFNKEKRSNFEKLRMATVTVNQMYPN